MHSLAIILLLLQALWALPSMSAPTGSSKAGPGLDPDGALAGFEGGGGLDPDGLRTMDTGGGLDPDGMP